MKEYVDKGGDSVWGGFAQVSLKIIAMELLFAGLGKGFSKFKQWRADRATKLEKLAAQTKKLAESSKKAAETTRVNKILGNRPAYSSAPNADQIGNAAKKVKDTLKNAKEMADDATDQVKKLADKTAQGVKEAADDVVEGTGKKAKSLITSELRKKSAQIAREDAQKVVDEFKRVMNNPTATQEEVRRATLALQGNKTAQNLLRTQPSDLLRAHYNAQMQQIYNDLDPVVIKRLQQKIKVKGNLVEDPEIRVFKGATGNAGDDLKLGRKIGADRDVTYQIKGKAGKWYDIGEELMEDAYSEAFNEMQYKFIPVDKVQRLKTIIKADQLAEKPYRAAAPVWLRRRSPARARLRRSPDRRRRPPERQAVQPHPGPPHRGGRQERRQSGLYPADGQDPHSRGPRQSPAPGRPFRHAGAGPGCARQQVRRHDRIRGRGVRRCGERRQRSLVKSD